MSPKLETGTVIAGRYQLERLLGQGGMATVWEAKHLMTRRSVAMKFLHAALDSRPEMRRRFLREAQAAAAVDHPNVVTVHDVFQLDDGMLVLVMARLEGETLAAKLFREGPLSVEETIAMLAPVVSAVGSAHARGVIHRDLKPDNVFLSRESGSTVVRVLDFGIAKLAEREGTGEITATGTVLGTPCYMAPEQAYAEKSVDHRADIWSIGAMLYEAITGNRPIEGESLGQVLKQMLTEPITPIFVLEPLVPSDIGLLIMRMLRIDPDGRPRDLREVHAVLAGYARSSTPSFGPPASSDTPRVEEEEQALALPVERRETPADLERARASALGEQRTLPEARRTESWKPLSVGSANTPGAHSISVSRRRGHRWLFWALGGGAVLLTAVAVFGLRSASHAAPDKPTPSAGFSAPPIEAIPTPAPPRTPVPLLMPVPSPPGLTTEASAEPAPAEPAPHPTVLGRPAAKAHKAAPLVAPKATVKAEAPSATASSVPPPSPSPAVRQSGGLHEAVPF